MDIGAAQPGEYGMRVRERQARLIQNLGGIGGGFLEEQTTRAVGRSNAGAVRRLAEIMGWNQEHWTAAYEAGRAQA